MKKWQFISVQKGEGMISTLVSMIVVVGLLASLITWYMLNVGGFQVQTGLNLALKQAQVKGYLTPEIVASTTSYLTNVGLNSVSVTSPQNTSPVAYGTEISITVQATTRPLLSLDPSGHPGSATGHTYTAQGVIISQYMP